MTVNGKHIIVDASGVRSTHILSDLEHTYNFLRSIPSLVKLEPLGLPHVVRATDTKADGVTGFQLLTTSHAAIHTWCNGERCGQIHLDIFSCEDFDEKALIEEFRHIYQPTECNIRILRRI